MTHLLDVLVTVGVVWTLGPLHWISLGYVFDALVFPDDYNWAMAASCVVGYAAVGAFTLVQGAAKRASLRLEQQQRYDTIRYDTRGCFKFLTCARKQRRNATIRGPRHFLGSGPLPSDSK